MELFLAFFVTLLATSKCNLVIMVFANVKINMCQMEMVAALICVVMDF
jgi:hypothetical protein